MSLKTEIKVIYVCSAYHGNVRGNTRYAHKVCRFVVDKGLIPFAPHLLYPQFLDDSIEDERKIGMLAGTLIMVKVCHELWYATNKGIISTGMMAEIQSAKSLNIPVRDITDEIDKIK